MKAPARWLEEPDTLPDELIASMTAHRELAPSEQERARVRVGVRMGVRQGSMALKWLGGLSVLVGLGGLLWSLRSPAKEAPPTKVAAPALVHTPPPVETPPPPVAEVPAAPEAIVEAKRSVRTKRAAGLAIQDLPAADPTAELALLRRARRLLASDPRAALALTDEHLHSYPSGVFAEERELLAIEALGQHDRPSAIERARAFATKYPRSVHQPRIEAALGAH